MVERCDAGPDLSNGGAVSVVEQTEAGWLETLERTAWNERLYFAAYALRGVILDTRRPSGIFLVQGSKAHGVYELYRHW